MHQKRPFKKTQLKQPSLPGTSSPILLDGEQLREKIENSNLDLIEAMGRRWALEFPSGKLPDHLVTEAFGVTKNFWNELSKARKGTSS